MEWLVRQHIRSTLDEADRAASEASRPAERTRAAKLREQGILVRLWRVPGTQDSIGLYEAPDATTLHEALASLPRYRYMDITVEPLATHPQERTDVEPA